jgi:hypothetical protein
MELSDSAANLLLQMPRIEKAPMRDDEEHIHRRRVGILFG